jgi:hypothetical protein
MVALSAPIAKRLEPEILGRSVVLGLWRSSALGKMSVVVVEDVVAAAEGGGEAGAGVALM